MTRSTAHFRRQDAGRACVVLLALCGLWGLGGCTKAPERPSEPLFLNATVAFGVKTLGKAQGLLTELTKYALFFGCPVVETSENPRFLIEGTLGLSVQKAEGGEGAQERFQAEVTGTLSLRDAVAGVIRETYPLGTLRWERPTAQEAERRGRLEGARKIASLLFYFGDTLGQEDVRNLVADLVIQRQEPYFYNDVVDKLRQIGLRAVPYLIWAMMYDHRTVELPGDLPTLTEEDADKVRVHLVANWALEQIFKRKSFLNVRSPLGEVMARARAWARLWGTRCASYLKKPEMLKLLRGEGPRDSLIVRYGPVGGAKAAAPVKRSESNAGTPNDPGENHGQ